PGDRAIVLLSSGNLAGTQAVVSVLKQRGEARGDDVASIWGARTMFDVAGIVSDAVRMSSAATRSTWPPAPGRSTHPLSLAGRSRANRYDCSGHLQRATSSRQAR